LVVINDKTRVSDSALLFPGEVFLQSLTLEECNL